MSRFLIILRALVELAVLAGGLAALLALLVVLTT